jgi:hypothetical protein
MHWPVPRILVVLPALIVTLAGTPGRAQPPEPAILAGQSAPDFRALRDAYIAEHGDQRVVAVRLEGLQHTHPMVVEQWIDIHPGDMLSRCDLDGLYERINRLAIFSSTHIELEERDDGVAIVIRIDEKWTLYPVPIFWFFPGTEVAGVILVEANAFGYNKGWALGGVYSNRGWYAIAGYIDPNIAFTSLWGRLEAFVGSGLIENDNVSGVAVQEYDDTRVDVQYALGWTFWDRLSPTLTGALRSAKVDDIKIAGIDPPTDVTLIEQGVKLIYSDLRYRFYYDAGTRLSVELQHGFPIDGHTAAFDGLVADATIALPVLDRSAFQASFHATYANFPVVIEDRLGGLDGSRTLPGGGLIAADKYVQGTVSYQVPLATAGIGTLTGLVFAEAGSFSRNDEPSVLYGGPGAGMRFYLRQVAIPAVGVDVGYELGSKQASLSVVIGYRPTR